MELQYTPGPWTYDPNDRHDLIVKKGSNIVCEVKDNRAFTLQQCQGNAKLIAAAPDLLNAAYSALNALKLHTNGTAVRAFLELNEAITKATQ